MKKNSPAAAPKNTVKHFHFWCLVQKSVDTSGFVAHCLDIDVVTMGNSVEHAIEMLKEATLTVVVDDLKHDRDPLDRRAPQAIWKQFYKNFGRAKKLPKNAFPSTVDAGQALYFDLNVVTASKSKGKGKGSKAKTEVPLAFKTTAAA